MQPRLRDDSLLSLILAFVREMDGKRDDTSPMLAPADADADVAATTDERERADASGREQATEEIPMKHAHHSDMTDLRHYTDTDQRAAPRPTEGHR